MVSIMAVDDLLTPAAWASAAIISTYRKISNISRT